MSLARVEMVHDWYFGDYRWTIRRELEIDFSFFADGHFRWVGRGCA